MKSEGKKHLYLKEPNLLEDQESKYWSFIITVKWDKEREPGSFGVYQTKCIRSDVPVGFEY